MLWAGAAKRRRKRVSSAVRRALFTFAYHSAYSLLEGALPLKKILYKASGDRQPAIAITDTNNLFVALEFSQKAMGEGLQPIIGCQVSIDVEDGLETERRGVTAGAYQAPVLGAAGCHRRRIPAAGGSRQSRLSRRRGQRSVDPYSSLLAR